MTAGVDLERRLSTWFEDQAPAHAPDRVLAGSLETVAVTDQRRSVGRRVGWAWDVLTRRQRLAIVLAASLALLVGGLVVGAWVIQQLPRPPALVVVRADGAFPDPVGITVSLVDADGSTRVLGSWTADDLGASYSDGAGVSVSPDGHLAVPVSTAAGTSEYRIVDLRDPTLPPRTPDAEAMFGAWGPDDRFAMPVNAGGVVVYDAHTGVSTALGAGSTTGGPRDVTFRPVWDLDGSGLLANGVGGTTNGFGVLELDGTTTPGDHPEFPVGVGTRRTYPDGARLQCVLSEDYGCEDAVTLQRNDATGSTDVFVDDRPDLRIADFAPTADGRGLWLLLETVAPTPRTVTLVQRAADGTERLVATFDGVADDPDEGSYFEAASFAGMAPDDSRIVVRIAGENGSPGARWAIDPVTGERTAVDGAPAGWLATGALETPRPPVALITEADPTIQGEWVASLPERVGAIPEGAHELVVRRSSATLDAGFGQRVQLAVAADGPDGLLVRQGPAAIDCAADSVGRYRWSIDDGRLALQATDDPCANRRLLLEQAFEPVLPAGDTGPKPVDAGMTRIASRFAVPFRLTVPAGGLLAQSHSADTVGVSRDNEGGYVTIAPATARAADPCDRFAAGAPLEPGLDAAVAYLEGLADVGATVERLSDVTIDGQAAPTFRLTAPSTCDRGLALFARNGRAFTVQDGSAVSLIEPRPGQVVVIIVASDPSGDPGWTRALLDSIDFLDDAGS